MSGAVETTRNACIDRHVPGPSLSSGLELPSSSRGSRSTIFRPPGATLNGPSTMNGSPSVHCSAGLAASSSVHQISTYTDAVRSLAFDSTIENC